MGYGIRPFRIPFCRQTEAVFKKIVLISKLLVIQIDCCNVKNVLKLLSQEKTIMWIIWENRYRGFFRE